MREYAVFCKGHPLLLLIGAALIFGLIGLWLFMQQRVMAFYHVSLFSLADALILVVSPPRWMIIGTTIVPLMLVALMQVTENDREPSNIVRLRKLSNVWARQLAKSLCVALTMTVLITAFTFIVGSLCAGSLINFDEQRSIFAFLDWLYFNRQIHQGA
jgi:ABC-type sugar transport system permease subunit